MRKSSTDIEQSDSAAPLPRGKWATQGGRHSAFKWALVLLPLAYFWFRLINNLRLEWTTDPQYGYGWIVPFLCLGLLIRRWHAVRTTGPQTMGLQDYETMGPQDWRSVVKSQRSAVRDQEGTRVLDHAAEHLANFLT